MSPLFQLYNICVEFFLLLVNLFYWHLIFGMKQIFNAFFMLINRSGTLRNPVPRVQDPCPQPKYFSVKECQTFNLTPYYLGVLKSTCHRFSKSIRVIYQPVHPNSLRFPWIIQPFRGLRSISRGCLRHIDRNELKISFYLSLFR